MAIALLLAAGSGERLGADGPKAFVPVAGRPMLEWSVAALRACSRVNEVVVALPEGEQAPAGTTGVLGGATRSESVKAALAAAGEGDPVLVCDAARPLLTAALADAVIDALDTPGIDGAVAAAPVRDTIKRAGVDGRVAATLDRSQLWAVQTPQGFRRAALARALAAEPDALAAATDDASLVERAGGVVTVVPWAQDNLKVTTPLDLRVADLLLGERRAH